MLLRSANGRDACQGKNYNLPGLLASRKERRNGRQPYVAVATWKPAGIMNLTNYMTKTEIIGRVNMSVPDVWPLAVDYGFSGVKGFAPNKIFRYPNCAVQVDSFSSLLDAGDKDILLRDADGMWIIGEKAHEVISPENSMNYESEMYGRNRYFSPGFRALMKAGLGIGLMGNHLRKYGGEHIMVQTGLPPKYKEQDTEMIKETIAGDYDFELKVGKAPFQRYHFSIRESDIYVMDQPMGALFSTITKTDGSQDQDGSQILRSNTLVFDPGFRTLDIFDIAAGMSKGSNTFDTLGMHEVFRRTVEEAHARYASKVTIPGMQVALKRGYITSFNRKEMKNKKLSTEFEDILYRNTCQVCEDALQKVLAIYDYLQNYDYLIVTGGTGAAWTRAIQERFKDMDNLSILMANRNDMSLSNVYSNVRGYYYFLVGMLRRHAAR